MSSHDASEGPMGSDWDGFASEEQRAAVVALLEQCAQFKGVEEALAGRRARLGSGPSFEFEPGWVSFPPAALRDVAAGPVGRLGMALMGAAAEFARIQKRPAPSSGQVLAAPAAARSGNSAWLEEASAERVASPPRPRRVFSEEGEGEESFAFLVGKLEAEGFGGTSFEQIAANKAKSAPKNRF